MDTITMFRPYDMRPTIEITAFTLTGISTLVILIRYIFYDFD